MKITDETPIVMLTVGQLREVIKSFIEEETQGIEWRKPEEPNYPKLN